MAKKFHRTPILRFLSKKQIEESKGVIKETDVYAVDAELPIDEVILDKNHHVQTLNENGEYVEHPTHNIVPNRTGRRLWDIKRKKRTRKKVIAPGTKL